MGNVTFHYLIQLIHTWMLTDFMGAISAWGAWTLACVPTLGGLVVGLMRVARPDFGPSMTSLIAAAQGIREISPLRPVTKMVAAAISIGTGASLGPEGPSVEIGANIGMLLGQVLQVSRERHRLLLGAGAAAGMAAGFNAPIAGVFFALEVVLGTTFATSAVSVVLLSAVVAALIARIGLGAQPAFALPVYEVRSP
jgi:H+/Cl- antiporter ClcA